MASAHIDSNFVKIVMTIIVTKSICTNLEPKKLSYCHVGHSICTLEQNKKKIFKIHPQNIFLSLYLEHAGLVIFLSRPM